MKYWLTSAVIVVALVACGGGSSSSSNTTTTSGSSKATNAGASSSSSGASGSSAGNGTLAQRILQALRTAPYETSPDKDFKNADIAKDAIANAVPERTMSVIDFQEATPTVISVGDSYLFSRGSQGEDEVQAVLFIDESGKCAGVAAVVPELGPAKAADLQVPTKFVTLDVSSLTKCSASAANDAYTGKETS